MTVKIKAEFDGTSRSKRPQRVEQIRYNPAVPEYLDITNWSRRHLFEFFRGYDNPYFNVCTRLDVTRLLEYLRNRPGIGASVAYHYIALRVANEIEPFRYRLKDGKVVVYDAIHGGTIVLLPNESFTFAYFDYVPDFEQFVAGAQHAIADVQSGDKPFSPDSSDDRIHFTVLPWVSFTSFAHARDFTRPDSIPKIAFGKFVNENERVFLPISVEVHHALMDGLHVGRFLSRFEEILETPEAYLVGQD